MVSIRHAILTGSLSFLTIFAVVAPSASAQCGPDGFGGTCCTSVTPSLPAFPGMSLPGCTICWNGCNPANQLPAKVAWTNPIQLSCTEYFSTLSVTDGGSGITVLSGPLVLDYTRTWQELSGGAIRQVWRFTAKVDLAPASTVAWTCQAPNCILPAGPYQHAFYYGYVDYTHDCAPGSLFETSIVLHHACDFFIHKPAISSTPGAFHPTRSFAIVAPHSSAQPFLPGNAMLPGGPFIGVAMRDMASLAPANCSDSDFIQSGQVTTLGGFCLTTGSVGPKQHWLRQFAGTGQCVNSAGLNGGFQALNFSFPNLPWFFLTSASIGGWTNPTVFPGAERVWVEEGLFIHRNACTGDWINVNYGATTRGGFPILHPVLLTQMTDLADNYNAPLFGPYGFPVVGNVNLSTKLIYVNTP